MKNVKSILDAATSNQGIEIAVLVGRDGFVIESSSSNPNRDAEEIGAMVSTGMGSAESVGLQLGLKSMEQAMMEYKEGIIVMSAINEDTILAVEASKSVNLGAVRLVSKKTGKELSTAI